MVKSTGWVPTVGERVGETEATSRSRVISMIVESRDIYSMYPIEAYY